MSILFHNTMRITEGNLEEFAAAVKRAVAFVEEHGPQLVVQVFLDEAGEPTVRPELTGFTRFAAMNQPE
ncbi:hypothetical protein [Nocardia cyriacigeorgica]|uniref:Antibiotic biosynthesis monooxygenase n=1 Tax=Nocardia cyriacigeorgica TaxID=135487 RepID=A0A4U8VW31_9NOCA|nr:hypothetical protein [Nocardia cyriacigeorgica]VFA97880.1 Uncharacterised protein [Nocardia cyriacigeorgica]